MIREGEIRDTVSGLRCRCIRPPQLLTHKVRSREEMATGTIKKGNLLKVAPDHGIFNMIYSDRDRFFRLDSSGKLTYFENDPSDKPKGKFLMIHLVHSLHCTT